MRGIGSDIDSVLSTARGDNEGRGVMSTEAVTTTGETSVGNITQVERVNNGTPRGRNGIDVGGRIDTGTNIVVNLSKRVLTDAEVSLLSKGLKFCPTRET